MQLLYPVALRLQGRRVLVVGGGEVAARKVESLMQAGAEVVVVSPEAHNSIQQQHINSHVEWVSREYSEEDLQGVFLVIAATDKPELNHAICHAAEKRGILSSNVTDPEDGSFVAPSVLRRGELLVSITTCAQSPAVARWLREKLEPVVTPAHGELAALLGRLRKEIQDHIPDPHKRSRVLRDVIDEKVLPLLERGEIEAAEEAIRSCMFSSSV